MELTATDVYEVLQEKGVEYFHHANTVKTSCSFLSQEKLLSRGVLDELGLSQTGQQTDELDRELGLWYDVFLDCFQQLVNKLTRRPCKSGPFYGPYSSWLAY